MFSGNFEVPRRRRRRNIDTKAKTAVSIVWFGWKADAATFQATDVLRNLMHELWIEDRRRQFVDFIRGLISPSYAAIDVAGRCQGFNELPHGIAPELDVELDRRTNAGTDVGARPKHDLLGSAGIGIHNFELNRFILELRPSPPIQIDKQGQTERAKKYWRLKHNAISLTSNRTIPDPLPNVTMLRKRSGRLSGMGRKRTLAMGTGAWLMPRV